MTRALDQILSDERIRLADGLITTPTVTVRPGGAWALSEYHWPELGAWRPSIAPRPFHVGVLVAAIGLFFVPWSREMLWVLPFALGAAIGAVWGIAETLLSRWRAPRSQETAKRGVMLALAGYEGVTVFASDDEQEIKLVRQKLEQTLLATVNGDKNA